MIGKRIIVIEAPVQLQVVAIATIDGWTISGMYNHTIGPSDKPKFAIYTASPENINMIPIIPAAESVAFSEGLTKKPIEMNNKAIVPTKVPNWRIDFLPYLLSK